MPNGEALRAELPPLDDTVVIGGGTAGAAVAGQLAERSVQSVVLLEAGPDYGPRAGGRWPAELLDARALPTTQAWGYDSGTTCANDRSGRRTRRGRSRLEGARRPMTA